MKISDLIQDIVALAEEKFYATAKLPDGHINDCVSVWIYYASVLDLWQVGLERPSKEQLENGEVDDWATVKSCINRVAFYTEANSLLEALLQLEDKLHEADESDFDS